MCFKDIPGGATGVFKGSYMAVRGCYIGCYRGVTGCYRVGTELVKGGYRDVADLLLEFTVV